MNEPLSENQLDVLGEVVKIRLINDEICSLLTFNWVHLRLDNKPSETHTRFSLAEIQTRHLIGFPCLSKTRFCGGVGGKVFAPTLVTWVFEYVS